VAFDLVDGGDAGMDLLPEAGKGIAVVPSPIVRVMETCHKSLAINHQLNMVAWPNMKMCKKKAQVLSRHCRARMTCGHAHTDSEDPVVGGVLHGRCTCLCQLVIVNIFAGTICVHGVVVVPPQGVCRNLFAVDGAPQRLWRHCNRPRQADKGLLHLLSRIWYPLPQVWTTSKPVGKVICLPAWARSCNRMPTAMHPTAGGQKVGIQLQ
jgi:hypothetical protein